MTTRVIERDEMSMKQLIVLGLIGSLIMWAACIIAMAYDAYAQPFNEWAVPTNRDEPHPCDSVKGTQGTAMGAQAYLDCINAQHPKPEFYTLPDGSKCASKDWDGYNGICKNPIIDAEAETMVPGEAVEDDGVGSLYRRLSIAT